MVNRALEPTPRLNSSLWGDAMHGPPWTSIARFGVVGLGQTGFDQPVKGPVHEGAADGEHPTQVTIGSQVTGNCERM